MFFLFFQSKMDTFEIYSLVLLLSFLFFPIHSLEIISPSMSSGDYESPTLNVGPSSFTLQTTLHYFEHEHASVTIYI